MVEMFRLYRVSARVEYTDGEWSGCRELPSFDLDGAVKGILTQAAAEKIAREIVTGDGLFERPGVVFHVDVTPVDRPSVYVVED